jgi:hypothetical protein
MRQSFVVRRAFIYSGFARALGWLGDPDIGGRLCASGSSRFRINKCKKAAEAGSWAAGPKLGLFARFAC